MNVCRTFLVFSLMLISAPAVQGGDSLPDRFCFAADRWERVYQEAGIAVYSQQVPVSDVLAFRAVGDLAAPIDQVMEVLRRVEITGEWMPDILTKFAVEERSDFEAITYSVNQLPWPFAHRELLLYNHLTLDRVRKYLRVEVYSIDDEKIPVAKGNVRARMYCGETLVRPAGPGLTRVELILFVDPKGFIPAWLVNLFQKKLPYNFLSALEEKAAATSYPLRPSYRKILSELEAILE